MSPSFFLTLYNTTKAAIRYSISIFYHIVNFFRFYFSLLEIPMCDGFGFGYGYRTQFWAREIRLVNRWIARHFFFSPIFHFELKGKSNWWISYFNFPKSFHTYHHLFSVKLNIANWKLFNFVSKESIVLYTECNENDLILTNDIFFQHLSSRNLHFFHSLFFGQSSHECCDFSLSSPDYWVAINIISSFQYEKNEKKMWYDMMEW